MRKGCFLVKSWIVFLISFFGILSLAQYQACAQNQNNNDAQNQPSQVQNATNIETETEYILGPGDVLEIRVYGHDDLATKTEILPDGTFSFPLIGSVKGAGLTVGELERVLEAKLADGYLVAPKVSISLAEYRSKKVFVFGEVKKPGVYPLRGPTLLLEVISMAEGFTELAGETITVVRPKKVSQDPRPLTVEEAQEDEIIKLSRKDLESGHDFWVKSGDSIYVSKALKIYVVGEVENPGEYIWEEGLTVYQAIAKAGGVTEKGSLRRTYIIRIKEGKEIKIKPKLSDLVQPDDVIKVPESYF